MRKLSLGILALVGLLGVGCSTSTTTQARDSVAGAGSGSGGDSGGQAGEGSGGSARGGATTGTSSAQGGSSAATTELTCSSYCAKVNSNCKSDTTRQYKSDDSCMNSCAAFRLGTSKDSSGNTLGCRAHFAELADTDPASNCAAAGPAGVGACGTNCDGYCSLMAAICPAVYEDEAVCHTACVQMSGVESTSYLVGGSGDNLQCRIYHATFGAEGFPDVHCPHASSTPMLPCAG